MILGIDLGSRNVKLVLFQNGEIKKCYVYETIPFYKKFGNLINNELQINFSDLGLPIVEKIISTGYGRLTIKVADANVISEMKAHVYGAIYQTGLSDFTLLDLGGQDTKVIKVKNNKMIDFVTNDKCAASSGRYLENMAEVLEVTIQELSNYWENPVELNSTCAVFGESELIGKIVEGFSTKELAAGVNHTIFKRVLPLITKLKTDKIVFTGGVAKNKALVKILRKETGLEVVVPESPLFNAAIGCCVSGYNIYR